MPITQYSPKLNGTGVIAENFLPGAIQGVLFDLLEVKIPTYEVQAQRIDETYFNVGQIKKDCYQLQNRRYIGSKQKLINWIFSVISKECRNADSFADIFGGTDMVGHRLNVNQCEI